MLLRSSVDDIKSGRVSKHMGHLAVTMRIYPRFLARAQIDEFLPVLAPEEGLFARYREYKTQSKEQDYSFQKARYEEEFELSEPGMRELERLATLSKTRDVHFICQCARGEQCHVDLMLLLAEHHFGAKIGELPFEYPTFRRRLIL